MCCFHVGYQKKRNTGLAYCGRWDSFGKSWIFSWKIPLVLMVTGALVGGVFLLISRLTQEAFGYGDSLMIAVTGVYLGFWNVLYLLVWAYVLAAVFAGYVLIRKGFQKDAAFPFVPFLLAAYIGIVCLGGI